MNLKNFKDNIPPQILERGLDYFENGNVIQIEELSDGVWQAEVEGSENYNVIVKLEGKSISDWNCDCPYDDDSICKHVVAVLYVISEKSADLKKQKTEKSSERVNTTREKIETIFKKVSKEDLKNFLNAEFLKERNLKNSFIANFAELIDENPADKYAAIVDNLYKAAAGRNGWVDYRNAKALGNSLFELSEKANKLLLSKKISECITLCKVLIEKTALILNSVDDSSGLISNALNNSFGIFKDAIKKSPPMLKDQLFEYCIRQYQDERYSDFGFDDEFLALLPELVTTEEQEKIFLNVIDERLSFEISNEPYHYTIVRLISAKIDFYRSKNMNVKANKILKENIEYPEFREIIVDQLIAKKDFAEAKNLCHEGINIAKNKNHPGTINMWMQKLLHISRLEEDIPDIRNWSEKLFFAFHVMEYYRILKSTYSGKNKEWKNECEKILEKLRIDAGNKIYYMEDPIAEVFIEESYYDRLLLLLQKSQNDIRFIDQYAEKIADKYPSELIQLYSAALRKHATTADRRVYAEVVKYLKKLEKIKGGLNEVGLLLDFFRLKYRNRRAMMELLNERFPA